MPEGSHTALRWFSGDVKSPEMYLSLYQGCKLQTTMTFVLGLGLPMSSRTHIGAGGEAFIDL